MKKLLTLLLAAAMLLSLCACGSSTPKKPIEEMDDDDWEAVVEVMEEAENEEPIAETEPVQKIYQLGETILIGDGVAEFTVDSFCFETVADWKSEIPGSMSDSSEYLETAENGNTFVFTAGTLNYLADVKEKTDVWVQFEVEYKDGYTFPSSHVGVHGYKETSDTNIFANPSATFEPLTDTFTREVRCYAEIPEMVETDTESPLFLKFVFSGAIRYVEYTVQVR